MTKGCKPTPPKDKGGSSSAGGSKTPCPKPDIEIVDRATGKVVSGTTVNKIVGQKVELQVRSKPNGFSVTKVQWTVAGTSPGTTPASTVKSYTMSPAKTDAPKQLTAGDLTKSNLVFFWIPQHGEGSKTVSVEAEVEGKKCTANVTFSVKCPTLNSFTSATGAIAIGNAWGSGLEMHCGTPTTPGIKWTVEVTPPAQGAGKLKLTQILKASLTRTTTGGTVNTWTIPDWWLDVTDPYESGGTIAASTKATLTSSDSPGMPLVRGFKAGTVSMTFKIYAMYKPNGAGSIWVPLGKLDWGWSGSATSSDGGGTWTGSGSHTATNPSGAKTDEFVTWVDHKTDSPPHPTWK